MTTEIQLRFAKKEDMPQVLRLIQELADFEKEPHAVEVTIAELERDGFSNPKRFDCILAEGNGKVLGMALYYPRYSTWKGTTLHLEDLIVSQEHRKKGVGTALYTAFLAQAKKLKVRRAEWVVLNWNTPAVNFYENSGANVLQDWQTVQMDEKAINDYIEKNSNENI